MLIRRLLNSIFHKEVRPHKQQTIGHSYVIIGNGIAGLEAAKKIRLLDPNSNICMISRESKLHWSRPALMYLYMRELRDQDVIPYPESWFAQKRIDLRQGNVVSIDKEAKLVVFDDQSTLTYDALLLAMGSEPRQLAKIDHQLPGVMGLYHLKDLAYLEKISDQVQRALIVGGGLIGVEFAEMLIHRGIEVDLVTQDALFAAHILPQEEAKLVTDHLAEHGVNLYLSDTVDDVLMAETDQVEVNALRKQVLLKSGTSLNPDLIGVAIGVRPATQEILGIDDLVNIGVRVDLQLRSADPYIFAAGDCAERILVSSLQPQSVDSTIPPQEEDRGLLSGTWYEARSMGQTVGKSMVSAVSGIAMKEAGSVPSIYDPQPPAWFNSAKFFDIEHQVYGEVPLINSKKSSQEEVESLLWIDEDRSKSLRLVYKNNIITGFCTLGLRLREEHCLQWIRDKKSLDEVLLVLQEIGFDAEFDSSLRKAQKNLINQRKSQDNA